MNNPRIILNALDAYLERSTRVIVYDRAALALGFDGAGPERAATMDVDAILPAVEMEAIEADDHFWRALEAANRELEPRGLYMTHLFADDQVILSPNWLQGIVPLAGNDWRWLRAFRPSTLDLILTKMMREDPQDLADIRFLLQQEPLPVERLRAAWKEARVPDIAEIRAAFAANQSRVLALLAGR